MVTMNPREMKTDAELEALFPVNDNLLERIENDMRQGTYDISQHIIMAKWEGQDEPVVLDGHTRRQAAINAGIESVPTFVKEEFATKDEAIRHAVKLQCNRRNLTDAELFRYMQMVDRRNVQDRDPATGQFTGMQDCTPGKSAERTAEVLGTSPRKVSQMRTIEDHADPETKEAVLKGKKSVNSACVETQDKRRAAKAATQANQNQPAPAPKAGAIEPDEPVQEPAAPLSEAEATLDQEPEDDTVTRKVTFRLDLADEIKSLGGSFDEHVNKAVEYYLHNFDEVSEFFQDDGEEDEFSDEYEENACDYEDDREEDDYLNA